MPGPGVSGRVLGVLGDLVNDWGRGLRGGGEWAPGPGVGVAWGLWERDGGALWHRAVGWRR